MAHYLEPLATRTRLAAHVRTDPSSSRGPHKATTAGREKAPFDIPYSNGKGPGVLRTDAVIDTSGTWSTPNPRGPTGSKPSARPSTASDRACPACIACIFQ